MPSASQKSRQIVNQHVERANTVCCRRPAMTAKVITKNSKVTGQRLDLSVPHGQVIGYACDKRQPWRPLSAVYRVVDLRTIGCCQHGLPYSGKTRVTCPILRPGLASCLP